MDWKDIAGPVINLGGTIIGTALGMPGLGAAAGQIVSRSLGLPENATPEEVSAEIAKNPEAAAAIATADAEWTRAVFETAQVQSKEVNKSIRAEIGKVSWWHWRHLIGYVVVIQSLAFSAPILRDLWFGNTVNIGVTIQLVNALVPYLMGLFGLLGYIAMDTSRRTAAAASGTPIDTIGTAIGGLVAGAIKRK